MSTYTRSNPVENASSSTRKPQARQFIMPVLEDRTLQAELAGYREYAERVPYRLLPGVW